MPAVGIVVAGPGGRIKREGGRDVVGVVADFRDLGGHEVGQPAQLDRVGGFDELAVAGVAGDAALAVEARVQEVLRRIVALRLVEPPVVEDRRHRAVHVDEPAGVGN